jgi:hypothetical protein
MRHAFVHTRLRTSSPSGSILLKRPARAGVAARTIEAAEWAGCFDSDIANLRVEYDRLTGFCQTARTFVAVHVERDAG